MFADKWCRREHADLDALSDWKKAIFGIIDKRISFYQAHPDLLPQKPKLSYRHLNNSISN